MRGDKSESADRSEGVGVSKFSEIKLNFEVARSASRDMLGVGPNFFGGSAQEEPYKSTKNGP